MNNGFCLQAIEKIYTYDNVLYSKPVSPNFKERVNQTTFVVTHKENVHRDFYISKPQLNSSLELTYQQKCELYLHQSCFFNYSGDYPTIVLKQKNYPLSRVNTNSHDLQ